MVILPEIVSENWAYRGLLDTLSRRWSSRAVLRKRSCRVYVRLMIAR